MHPDFAKRLKIAGVMQDPAYYARRWAAVSKYGSKLRTVEPVLGLVRTLAGEPVPGTHLQAFRAALTAADPGYVEGDNALEMAILAGFALQVRWGAPVRGDDPLGDAAALAVITWDFAGRSQGQVAAPFVCDARAHRDQRALAVASAVLEAPEVSVDLPEEAGTLPEAITALEQIVASQQDIMEFLTESLKGQQEEANVAWWVLGEHSRDLRSHVSALPALAAPLILGKELGDLARRLPGNPGALAILDRMLRASLAGAHGSTVSVDSDAEKATLFRSVSAAPPAWRAQVTAERTSTRYGSLTPVLTAIAMSLDVDAEGEWLPLFKKASGFDPNDNTYVRAPLALAAQTYDECLFVAAIQAARA